MHDSLAIANRFLELAEADDTSLTPMQVLKLVYIAHGWRLGLYGRPLIRDDVQAWQYGPVIPRLYNALRNYKGDSVTSKLKADNATLNSNENSVVEQVYDIYGKMSGSKLSRLTHAPKTPWAKTYRDGVFGIKIRNDLIEDHYEELADRAENRVHA